MDFRFTAQNWLKRFYRRGYYFQRLSRELSGNYTASAESVKAYQAKKLQKMFRYCYDHVPYYTDLFRQLRLSRYDIQHPDDLRKIPLMDKQTVRENFDKLISRKHVKLLGRTAYTSGTSGSASRFLRDYHSINFENAIVLRHRQQVGISGRRKLTIRGDLIVPMAQEKPPFWKYNAAEDELMMSSYHLSPDNARIYVDKILEFQPDLMWTFPSTAFLLARFFRAYRKEFTFQGIFTSSECLEPYLRQQVEETFHTNVYDWYGQAERVAAIGQCAAGTYHVEEDYSLVEFVEDEHGCEIVGTHLHNFCMPLLRYRTGDYVEQGSGEPCSCGHHSRTVERIIGRFPEVIITPEGYHVVCAPAFVFKGLDNVLEGQFYQARQGEVTIRILSRNGLSEGERTTLIQNTLQYTSPQMRVSVEEVPSIQRGPNGKFISIVNDFCSLREASSLAEVVGDVVGTAGRCLLAGTACAFAVC